MPIQYEFFTICPLLNPEAAENLNTFLRSHKILNVQREFVADSTNSRWYFTVEYLEGKAANEKKSGEGRKRIDYREVLSPETFALYARLRDWRKQLAEQESVPLYTIFTNKQLAAISSETIATHADLQKVEGVGAARVEKYGDAVIEIVTVEAEKNNETGEQPLSEDS